jgi:hypothetical protein
MNMKFLTGVLLAVMLLPSLAMAQTGTRATFTVTKDFADGNNVDEVVVTLDCTSGLILDQDKVMGDGDTVEFIVTEFTNGVPDCFIVEGDVTDGYEASYSGNGIGTGNSGDCAWDDVQNGFAGTCDITNEPAEVDIVVTKEWVISGDNNDVDLGYRLKAECNNIYRSKQDSVEDEAGKKYKYRTIGKAGDAGPDTEDFIFKVRPGFPSSNCRVGEKVFDSAIEVSNGCGSLTVSAGNGASCKITNTVFFEGIPTLSQYGMAIMALLMLGVGFVGFRRFV